MLRHVFTICVFLSSFAQVASAQSPVAERLVKSSLDTDAKVGFESFVSRGYTPLFNGTDLSGWRNPYPHGEAKVVDGEIQLSADQKFFLVTEQKYSDFRLSVDIHLPKGPANSGVMFRCHVDQNAKKKVFGYQAECDGSDRRWSGGLFDEARRRWIWPSTKGRSLDQFLKHEKESKASFKTPAIANALDRNGWNRFVITCVKDAITIDLNGVQTVRFRDGTDASGFIGIQHHGEKGQMYRFRNLFIKALPVIPAEGHVTLTLQQPASAKRINDHVTLIDFGKVAFGNLKLPVQVDAENARVHFGEKLKDGRVDRKPPGTVRYGVTTIDHDQEDGDLIVPAPVYARNIRQGDLLKGDPPAVLTPDQWRSIMPFRWVEIEGLDDDYPYDLIRRRAAFSETWNDNASEFECSDDALNRIWELCKYSIKATTFAGVYVDGDRERIPYEADAYLNQISHFATDDDGAMAGRTFDWLMENGTWPTEWAPHMVFMAHAHWMHNGDLQWLTQRYESLKTKTLLDRSGEDGLVRSTDAHQKRTDIVDWPKGERDGFVFTEINTVVNAFHIAAIEQMTIMAAAVGKQEDATAFADRAKLSRAAFQKTLFDSEAGIYRDGVGTDHSSLHANLFPLAFDLIPENEKTRVLEWLKQQDMRCSVYAAQYFMEGLLANGGDSHAIDLITADNDRSWKHMSDSDTTITWEAWNMNYKPNQDWNHAWGAAPANLLPRFILGVQPASPGWESALIRPCTGDLKFARGQVPTPTGPLLVDWKNGATFTISLALPAGLTANIDLPAADGTTEVLVDGKAVDAAKKKGRWILSNRYSGEFIIEVK